MLASIVVGFAVPDYLEPEYWLSQQRLIPHADRCTRQLHDSNLSNAIEYSKTNDAFNNLGMLFADQDKLAEAEEMYQWALNGYEKTWGPEHTSTLDTINNLGLLYADQGKPAEAEKMCRRAGWI